MLLDCLRDRNPLRTSHTGGVNYRTSERKYVPRLPPHCLEGQLVSIKGQGPLPAFRSNLVHEQL
jgi:hypothetical protein